MGTVSLLTGTEGVLVAQVPKAGRRWTQGHFNMDVGRLFFRVEGGEEKTISVERIDLGGKVIGRYERRLVLGPNRNYRIEFAFDPVADYPAVGRPVLVIVEMGLRTFRYVALLPGEPGHDEMTRLTEEVASVGSGVPRVITTLDEVELRWDACPLR